MRSIKIKNPLILESPYTMVSSEYSTGNSLSVEDSSGFADNDLILVGGKGNEKSATTDLTATPPDSSTLTISALSFAHDTDEPVQKVLWNKYDIQYKTSVGGSWTALATAQSFDWSKDYTVYNDSNGATGYYYRSRYYNSALAVYSDWSDTIGDTGFTRLQVGYLIKKVRSKARDVNGEHATNQEIIGMFNSVNDIVKGMNKKWWFLLTEYPFTTTASDGTYPYPDNFERAHRLKYELEQGATDQEYFLAYQTPTVFDAYYGDHNLADSDNLAHYTIDVPNAQIKIGPQPVTASLNLTLYYYKSITDLDSVGDTIIAPLSDLYVYYAVGEIWEDKDDENKAAYYKKEFGNLLTILNQMRAKSPTPQVLKRFAGHKGFRNLLGGVMLPGSPDASRENYW